jgi:F-type H+-transporting ATPase subunit epsilon
MNSPLHLEVLTPDKSVLDTAANTMRVLLPDGWWGILPGHAPMISYIDSGVIYYEKDDVTRFVAIYQGTIEVQKEAHVPTRVRILTAAAEEGDDLETVKAALKAQADKLEVQAKEAEIEFQQLRLSLERALQNSNITEMG